MCVCVCVCVCIIISNWTYIHFLGNTLRRRIYFLALGLALTHFFSNNNDSFNLFDVVKNQLTAGRCFQEIKVRP